MEESWRIVISLLVVCFTTLTRGLSYSNDKLSCYIRAQSHYVLGEPSNGKYYSFTFDPPLPMDRKYLDPCLMNCILQPACSAVLYYKRPEGEEDEADMNEGKHTYSFPSPLRCISVVTDESMRLEVMFGDVSDLYIKRGDRNCRPDEGDEDMVPTTTPVLLSPNPKNYYDTGLRNLLINTNGDYQQQDKANSKRPKVQLNALNFLWGHQIFAHIHHNSQDKQSAEPDIDVQDMIRDDKTTIPPQAMMAPAPTPPTSNYPGYDNDLRSLYNYNGGGLSFGHYNQMGNGEDEENEEEGTEEGGIEVEEVEEVTEPMGKEVIGLSDTITSITDDRTDEDPENEPHNSYDKYSAEDPEEVEVDSGDMSSTESDLNVKSNDMSAKKDVNRNLLNAIVGHIQYASQVLPENGAKVEARSYETTTVPTEPSTAPTTSPTTTPTTTMTMTTSPTTTMITSTTTTVPTTTRMPQGTGDNMNMGRTGQTIAFSATLTSTLSVTSSRKSSVVIFDDAIMNVGNAYDPTLGVFIAPVPGVYIFTVDVQSMKGKLASLQIMKNDNVIHSIWANGRNTADRGVGSGTVGVTLAEGDRVFVVLLYDGGYTYVLKDVSRFTGFKLSG